MDLNDIKRNPIVKTILFILTAALMTASVICISLWGFGMSCGYDKESDFYKSEQCRSYAETAVWRTSEALMQASEEDIQLTLDRLEYLDPEVCNVGIEIYQTAESEKGAEETLLGATYMPEKVGVSGEHEVSDGFREYVIKYYVSDPLTAKDGVYWAKKGFDIIQPNMDVLVPAALCCFGAMLLFMFCMMSCAGYRKDREGVTLNPIDRIPLDIFTAAVTAAAIGVTVCIGIVLEDSWYRITYSAVESMNSGIFVLCGSGVFLISVLITGLLASTATRVKTGGWWRNTLIFFVLRFIWKAALYIWRICIKVSKFTGRVMKKAFMGIPLVWKTMLAAGVPLGIMVICAGVGSGEGFLFAFFIFLMLMAALLYVSLCMKKLQKGARELASGNDEYRIETEKMIFDFKEHGENLNNIGEGISIAVAQRMKSERMKTELITNVSHDLKTPLTSIINYVDLLGKEELKGAASEYVEVLSRQAARMKKLTEDVVEASKVSTGNMAVELTKTDTFEIINQAAGEYKERFESSELDFILRNKTGRENVYITADGRLLWRAIDNLMSNICKYSQPGTRVYVDVSEEGDEAVVSFKNISKEELNISEEELMERFVRGDSSRSSEGSGLGLNIAKNLVGIQGGTLNIKIDGDLFKAEIRFKREA